MAKVRRLTPQHPEMFRARVVRTRRVSPSMQRVTVTGPGLGGFPWLGYDHWFRLFLQLPHQRDLRLPEFTGSQWWQPYLAIPEDERPHCANYSVADYRRAAAELDIDFVVHRGPTGEVEGRAAIWACGAGPGTRSPCSTRASSSTARATPPRSPWWPTRPACPPPRASCVHSPRAPWDGSSRRSPPTPTAAS